MYSFDMLRKINTSIEIHDATFVFYYFNEAMSPMLFEAIQIFADVLGAVISMASSLI